MKANSKKKENNNNKTYLVRTKASDLSDFPGVNTPVELNGHFCYCTFKGSVCKMPVNALKNLQKTSKENPVLRDTFRLMHHVHHAVLRISESNFNRLSESFYHLSLFRV